MAKLLLVDDEPDLLGPLVFALERDGHVPSVCSNGEQALAALQREPWDLMILDLMLPDVSGTTICRRVRAEKATASLPVVIVSARADEFDRVVGFELGADDYVTKPYSLRELLLRVNALLRRTRGSLSDTLVSGHLEVDREAHRCMVDGEPVALTVLELRLLLAFLDNRGRALARGELRDLAWGRSYRVGERAVDTNIKRIRKKLGTAANPLETVRGVGYRWNEVGEDQ